ncbi:putative acetoacetate decarboxylase [Rhodobiaceae bacterium]|nr:putative acetoacetate decarboxylase [Rhodobiaceae bacterium]
MASTKMGNKNRKLGKAKVLENLLMPSFLLKIILQLDCNPRTWELVEYALEDLSMKHAWEGRA